MKNSRGFALIHALLILVVVGLIAGTGWYVYKHNHKSTAPKANSTEAKTAQTSKTESDPTAEWATYTPTSKDFSIKLPDGWKAFHQDNDVLIINVTDMNDKDGSRATITEVTGGRDGLNGMIVAEDASDISKDRFAQYKKVGELMANGLTGTKYLYEQTTDPQEGIGMPRGSSEYAYYFIKKGKGIYIAYTLYAGESSHLATIEKTISTLR